MKRFTVALAAAFVAATVFAQQEPKNVQVLKGMPAGQLIRAMQFISASLGVTCDFCHVRAANGELEPAKDDKPEKKTAREMMQLVMDTNAKYFKGNTEVSCETCHRGAANPVSVPVLPIALHAPQPAPPATAEVKPAQPTRDDIVSRYEKALGSVNANALASTEAKGTRDTQQGSMPFEIVTAPGRIRATQGETTMVVNGTNGWVRDAKGTHALRPNQVDTVTQIAAAYRLTLPSEIPENARTHRLKVDDREYDVLLTPATNGTRKRLYFDPQTGLLAKRITLTQTPIGWIPQETDFEDYRDVNGMKLPFLVRVDTIDPRAGATRHYSEIRLNAKAPEKDFEEPK